MKPQRFKNQEIARAYMMGVIDTQKKILGLDKDPKPKTNFDNVTASPETLADAVYHFLFGRIYCEGRVCEDVNGDCERCFLNWLKQEARDEK